MNNYFQFKQFLFLIVVAFLISGFVTQSIAQLTGIKTIPGDYASLQLAVTDLNTQGVGTGGVTFNISAGYTETITEPIIITASGTVSDPILFQKSGAGANPIISRTDAGTVSTSTLGGQGDAVIIIQGSDYITFDAINVSASDQGIEYGYYLRKASDTNGCKFVTIKNSVITMTKGTSQYVAGIYSSNNDLASTASSSTGITVTSVDGRNENVVITGNTISNVFTGILLRGFNHTTAPYDFYDQNFQIGASGAGNIIQNYAGNAAATAYGVYLIYHNNANVSYNTIDNAAGGSGATSIVYGIFNSIGTLSAFTANNNNLNITTSATTSAIYGINNAATGNLEIENNIITINTTTSTSGVVGYIYNSSAAASLTVSISNNTFIGTTLSTTGATYLIYNNSSQLTPGITNVQGNSISGLINRTGTTGATYCYYNNGSPTGTENIFDNVFDSVTTIGSGALYGILSTTGSAHTHNIYNNIIRDFSGGTGIVYGIHRTLASGSVYGNSVYNITGGGIIYGLSNGSGNNNIYKNSIYNLTSTSTATTTGLVSGIYISGVTNHYIYNNFISDLKAPAAASIDAIRGINSIAITASSNIGVYYNTIFLNASSSGANFGTSGIFHTNSTIATTAALDMRNNIVVNNSVPSGTGLTVAFRRSAANVNLNNYSTLSNNNDFYAGTPGPANLIFFDGTNADQTIADFKTRVAPRESASISENPAFVNSTTPPYDLRINIAVPTQIESGGLPISSPLAITDDFDGTTRNLTTPDIGANEFNGIALDLTPPTITYSPLGPTNSTAARNLVVTVTDLGSGVPATAPGWPHLYWRINTGSWNAATPTNVNVNEFTFSFGSGVAVNDVVEYYVVAQDGATPPNVGAFPSAGAGGFTANPPAAATPPTNPSSYLIVEAPLAGDYTVGITLFNSITGRNISFEKLTQTVYEEVWIEEISNEKQAEKSETTDKPAGQYQLMEVQKITWVPMENGEIYSGDLFVKKSDNPEVNLPSGIEGVYATITAAVQDLNLRGVSGATRFLLDDASYPTETFPININVSSDFKPTSTNTVTIRPNNGVTATIAGAAANSRIFGIYNSHIIIDGSNSGGSDRNLTLENTSPTSPQVLLIGSTGTTPIINVTVKNTSIINGVQTSSALIVSDGVTAGNPGYFNNITIENNNIQKAYIGIYSNAFVATGNGSGLLITRNDLNTSGANSVRFVGIYVQGADGAVVSKNSIANFDGASAEDDRGVWFASGTRNSIIESNFIYSLKYTGTGGYGAHGVTVSSATANSNNTIRNNSISDISGDGWGTSLLGDNPFGIYIFGAQSGVQAYYNSIHLSGNTLNRAASISAGIALGTGSIAELKNNIIVNNLGPLTTLGLASIGIYLQTDATQLVGSNYNDIFVNPTGTISKFIGQIGTTGYVTLSDWQTASSQDLNSISADPNFIGLNDLRPAFPTPVYGAGIPIAGITTDILGNPRNTTTPTIGAYENPIASIGWANLQWPQSGSILAGSSLTVYAQIWIDGITNQPGPGTGIQAWIGVNNANTDPSTWTTWIPAVYNVDVGNNDEYMAMIGASLAPGTYYYASRFNVFNGDFVYGGYNAGGGGFWDGINNVSGVLTVDPLFLNLWERSAANSNLPAWFGTANNERGLGYGRTSDGTDAFNNRVFVVSRTGGNFVKVLNAATGADIGDLNTTGITGGLIALNDVGVTDDGKILACNVAQNNNFKVYMWDNELSAPIVALEKFSANRVGDKFTVVGNYSAGTAQIWAASATTGQHLVYKWTMSGGVFDSIPQVIVCSDALTTGIASAAVGPLPSGDFYWNANGQNARKYLANGTLVGIIPGGVVGTGSNAILYLGQEGGNEYVATFAYGTGNQNARILEIPAGDPTQATLYAVTPVLGTNANANGTGDVAFQVNPDFTVNVFVLSTNNGLGAYKSSSVLPVELTSFAANVIDRTVTLTWRTESESNSYGFEIERSQNKAGWNTIGFVKSAGNSTQPKNYSYTDSKVETGSYSYRLKMIDLDGSFTYSNVVEVEIGTPVTFSLSQNYPNPFNPTTRIDYQIPFNANVQIELYSITGEKVATLVSGETEAGFYTLDINAATLRLSSGVYFYRMISTDIQGSKFVDTKKMILLK